MLFNIVTVQTSMLALFHVHLCHCKCVIGNGKMGLGGVPYTRLTGMGGIINCSCFCEAYFQATLCAYIWLTIT